jgi:hypothetical protein
MCMKLYQHCSTSATRLLAKLKGPATPPDPHCACVSQALESTGAYKRLIPISMNLCPERCLDAYLNENN